MAEDRKIIQFTPESLRVLKRSYLRAIKAGKDEFKFNGQPILVSYAKYLIEFLEAAFREDRNL